MIVQSINSNNPNFGYHNILKTEWIKGNLPTVKRGFYGDVLTKINVSLEHLLPHSKGGKTELNNLVLASKQKNNARGNKDIENFIDRDSVVNYLNQFIGVRTKQFDGNSYIKMILTKLEELLGGLK